MTDENSETNNSEEETLEDGSTIPAVDGGAAADGLPTTPEEPKQPVAPRLSIAFPVVVAVAQVALIFYFLKTSTTPTRTYIGIAGAPILATLLLVGWWMLSRTVPLRDRFAGLLLAVAAVAVPLLTALPMDVFFLVYLLPVVTTSVVLVAAVTGGMHWKLRRKGLAGGLLLCMAAFCLMRVAGVDGNMAPFLAWRWSGEKEIASVENKVAAVLTEAAPEDWPGFRGATRDSRNLVSRFGTDWAAHPPKELWRRSVGPGWSSFAVVGDYFFTQEQRGAQEAVVCYETATGEQVWSNTVDVRFVERMGDGPRATPTFQKGRLYTQGATGILQCIDAATGKTIWQRDLVKDGGKKAPTWGFCSSPLLVDDLVIAYTGAGGGKSVLAYRQDTGEIAWSAGKGGHGYSSPQWARLAQTPQVLMSSNYGLESFDAKTGALLWEQEWNIKGNPRVAQSYVVDDFTVIGGTGQGKGARFLRVDKDSGSGAWSVKTSWTSKRFRPYFNDYVYYNGYCYGYDGNRIACMDTTDGKVRWTGERYGGQVLLLAEMEMILAITEGGEVLLIPAFPGGIEVVARLQALHGRTWNHPVVAHNKLFVRNDKEAVCYELPPVPVEEVEAPAAH